MFFFSSTSITSYEDIISWLYAAAPKKKISTFMDFTALFAIGPIVPIEALLRVPPSTIKFTLSSFFNIS